MLNDVAAPVRSRLSYADENGLVYMTPDLVLRAVPAARVARMEALLASGLPEALAERRLMPLPKISEHDLPGAALVIEQRRLPIVTYPYEWSFAMLRDAAVAVLEVNVIANQFGYELGDCHGFNVVFEGGNPWFVDLGSLVPRPAGARGWTALEEYFRFYDYPLRIWRAGGGFMARGLIATSGLMSHGDFGVYRWPLRHPAVIRAYDQTVRWSHVYRLLSHFEPARVAARMPRGLRTLAKFALANHLLPAQRVDCSRRAEKVRRFERRGGSGFWSNYQGGSAAFVATPRFRRMTEIVKSAGLASLIELAGNQGRFSRHLIDCGAVSRVLCTDYDEAAVDHAHALAKSSNQAMDAAVLDFVHPMVNSFGEPPATRLQADGVIALAVSHHLLLTQRVPIERMLESIASYARRFVAVEFMPLGLWNGTEAPPIPSWYTLEWFREVFGRHFEITHDESLETNRHLFGGLKRSGNQA